MTAGGDRDGKGDPAGVGDRGGVAIHGGGPARVVGLKQAHVAVAGTVGLEGDFIA